MATSHNQPIKVRVNRAFWLDGKVQKVGDTVDLAPALASELYGAGKVERGDREPSDAHREALQAAKAKAARKDVRKTSGSVAAN
jgi:hypothetical protein